MADTTYIDYSEPTINAEWLNEVNALRHGRGDPARGAALLEYVGPGTAAVSVREKLLEWVTPKDFGAAADGSADDSAALLAAIQSGYPLDFGGGIYRIDSPVVATVVGTMRWRANNARILAAFAFPQQDAVKVTLGAGKHSISGFIALEAGAKAFNGWVFDTTSECDLNIDGLSVTNVYRSSTLFSGGNGVLLTGPFRYVTLEDVIVENARMAAGAGIIGSEGIFGISVLSNAFGLAQYVNVINPFIDKVWCEDASYVYDQDGIRYIVSNPAGDAVDRTFSIEGGVIRNCFGRGIKSQCEVSSVIGTKFIRTLGFSRGYGNEEIDYQEGGGLVKDIQCVYNGSAPEFVVQLQSSRVAKSLCSAVVDGAHVQLGAGTTLTRFMTTVPFDTGTGQVVRVSNVDIAGAGSLTLFAAFYGGYDKEFHLFMSDITAAPTTRFVAPLLRGTGGATGTVKAARIVNTGSTPIQFASQDLVSNPSNWPCIISLTDSVGFVDNVRGQSIFGDIAAGSGFYGVRAIVMEGAARSGALRPISFTLETGQSYTIPSGTCVSGNASNALLIAVSDADKESQGLFFAGDNGVLKGTTSANWEVSVSTSEPASGTYRLWRNLGLNIRNASGSTMTFTILLIG